MCVEDRHQHPCLIEDGETYRVTNVPLPPRPFPPIPIIFLWYLPVSTPDQTSTDIVTPIVGQFPNSLTEPYNHLPHSTPCSRIRSTERQTSLVRFHDDHRRRPVPFLRIGIKKRSIVRELKSSASARSRSKVTRTATPPKRREEK